MEKPRPLAPATGWPRETVASAGEGAAPTAGAVAGLSIGGPGMALDDTPDVRARREYRARLEELRAELDEAERFDDLGRAERLRAELDQLMDELSTRFRGRARLQGPSETARKAVTKVLRMEIGKLLEKHPALGRHLRESVRMGVVCLYAPPAPIVWKT